MATYYVSAASGSDTDDGSTEALAWLTIDHAMNTVVAGDHVYIKSDGNYNETATLDTVGTLAAPIVFEGYASVTGDNGVAVIDGQDTRANCLADSVGSTTIMHYVFKNLRLTQATGRGALLANRIHFYRCKFDNNGTHGADLGNAWFIQCEFSDNANDGANNLNTGTVHFYAGCRFYRNVNSGFTLSTGHAILFGCEFFSNGSNGVVLGSATSMFVVNCTFDGDSKDSIICLQTTTSNGPILCLNNVIYDGITGIQNQTAQGVENYMSFNNLINSNTTDYTNASTLEGEITSAPGFYNEGVNDYRPGDGSALSGAGFDANKIEGF
jgi:hypothetical protein